MTTLISILLVGALASLVASAAAGVGAALVAATREAPGATPQGGGVSLGPSRSAPLGRMAVIGVGAGLVLLLLALILRTAIAGHAPWLIVLGFAGVLFTYIGAGLFFIGEHSYGGQ